MCNRPAYTIGYSLALPQILLKCSRKEACTGGCHGLGAEHDHFVVWEVLTFVPAWCSKSSQKSESACRFQPYLSLPFARFWPGLSCDFVGGSRQSSFGHLWSLISKKYSAPLSFQNLLGVLLWNVFSKKLLLWQTSVDKTFLRILHFANLYPGNHCLGNLWEPVLREPSGNLCFGHLQDLALTRASPFPGSTCQPFHLAVRLHPFHFIPPPLSAFAFPPLSSFAISSIP